MKKVYIYLVIFVISFSSTVLLLTNRSALADQSLICLPTPTPSISPSPTPGALQNIPSPGNPGNPSIIYGSGSSTKAPASTTCTIPFKAPSAPIFTRVSSTQIRLNWWPSTDSVDSQSIIYGYSASNMPYGVILDSTTGSYTINDLSPNKIIFARICAYRLGCASCSPVLDP